MNARSISCPAGVAGSTRDRFVRDSDAGLDVLMVRRSMQASFMPGAYVFPGGAVDAADGDARVLQQLEGDEAVVGRGLGVVEDGGDLLEVLRPKEEIDVVEGLVRQQRERLGIDGEQLFVADLFDADVFLRQQAVFGVIGAEFEEFLVVKVGRGHGEGNLKGI